MNIRRIVETEWANIAEWENPEELSRDWDSFYNHFVHTCHCGDFIHEGDLVIFLKRIRNAGYGALDPMTLEPVKDKVWDVLCLPLA